MGLNFEDDKSVSREFTHPSVNVIISLNFGPGTDFLGERPIC